MYPWTVYPSNSSNEEPTVSVNDCGGEILIIFGIHGDEPCGWNGALEFYKESASQLIKPVTFVFANPFAAQKNVRFISEDLNRNFGSNYDSTSSALEMKLAGHLQSIISSFDIAISLHSTQSTSEPFSIIGPPIHKKSLSLLNRVGISKTVLIKQNNQRGSLVVYPGVVEFECGLQHSKEAKENAKRIIRGAIASIGGLKNTTKYPHNDVRVFELQEPIPKPDEAINIYVDNLTTIPSGTLVADGGKTKFFAPTDFTPILLSATGYENILGYRGKELGWLSEAHFETNPNKNDYITEIIFPQK